MHRETGTRAHPYLGRVPKEHWWGFGMVPSHPSSEGATLEAAQPERQCWMANLQGLKSGNYLERKRILHGVFINAKWPGKPLRDFSCSDPHFLLRGHPWDSSGKQGSHFLISCYTRQTRLKCLISCCSLPCLQQSEGKNNPSPTNRYNHSHFCTCLVWVRAQMGPGEGRDGEAWMQTHQYAWRAPALAQLPIPRFVPAKPYGPAK